MKSLAAIANGLSDNLLTRAADVALKERRRLLLMVRETPLNLAHLRNMTSATEMGAIVFPPLPAFYHRPTTIDEIVDDTVERVLALLGVEGAAPQVLVAACSAAPRQRRAELPGAARARTRRSDIPAGRGCRCSGRAPGTGRRARARGSGAG